jgi:arabinofuranan 3-O-arabinosyltransferase
LRVALESSLSGSTVKVTPYLVPGGPRITAVRASTDAGVRTTVVSGYGPWQVELAPGSTRHVDLTLVTDGAGLYEPVGLREVEIPGTRAERVLDLPAAPAGRDVTGVVLSASPASRTGCVVLADGTRCSPALEQEGEDDSSLGAQFTLPSPVDVALSGSVRARPGPELAALATAQRPDGVRVSASSTELLDVRAGAGAAYDGDAGTTWIASPDDPAPVLTLRWPVAHTISGADVSRAVAASGRRATGLSVDTGSGFVPVDLGVDGQASWTPGC